MTVRITRVVETSIACPAQWDAWDADGNYYYMRYRSGAGSVRQYRDNDWWFRSPEAAEADFIRDVARFQYGHPLDGSISLVKFCELAGLDLAIDVDETDVGRHMTDELIFHGLTELLEQEDPS